MIYRVEIETITDADLDRVERDLQFYYRSSWSKMLFDVRTTATAEGRHYMTAGNVVAIIARMRAAEHALSEAADIQRQAIDLEREECARVADSLRTAAGRAVARVIRARKP